MPVRLTDWHWHETQCLCGFLFLEHCRVIEGLLNRGCCSQQTRPLWLRLLDFTGHAKCCRFIFLRRSGRNSTRVITRTGTPAAARKRATSVALWYFISFRPSSTIALMTTLPRFVLTACMEILSRCCDDLGDFEAIYLYRT